MSHAHKTPHDNAAKLKMIRDTGFDRYFKANDWAGYNLQFFDNLADKYDATNVLHSLGTKSRFDRKAVQRMPIAPGSHLLDVCTGSGDIAILIAGLHRDVHVTGVDASTRMLAVARRKAQDLLSRITFQPGDALALDFPDNTFDGAVISFGLRNLASLEAGLRELKRVVKPGGFVCNIDQGKPRSLLFRAIYEMQFKRVAPIIGKLVFHRGEYNSFRYLPESNKYFPDQHSLADIFREVGFEDVRVHEYWLGAVAQHVARVPDRKADRS